LPFCPLRLSCRRRLSSSSMKAPTVSSTQRRRSSPSPVLRQIEAEGAHCLYRESRFVPPLFVYVFPAHEVCQSRHQHGSLDLPQQSGQTGVKQSTHAATKFIKFVYTGFDLHYCNRGACFSHYLRANDDQMSLPCGVFVFQYNLFTSSSGLTMIRCACPTECLYFSITFLHHRRILSLRSHQPCPSCFLSDWTD